MGFNTPILILNDAMHEIPKDEGFPKRLHDAILRAYPAPDRGFIDVPIGNHINGCTVYPSHHANGLRFIATGGNMMKDFGGDSWNLLCDEGWDGKKKEDEFSVRVLKSLARQLGYSVRKNKPRTKK